MSKDVPVILLIALAGFLIGGAYTTWRSARRLAVVLLLLAVLAAGGAVAWLVS